MKRRDLAPALIASVSGTVLIAKDSLATVDALARPGANAAEIAAGVIPTDYSTPSGPMRYGAKGDSKADDTLAWNQMARIGGYHFVPDGVYKITAKVQTSAFVSIVGATRQNTILQAAGFTDYLLEIGNRANGPNPNVGALQRLRFLGHSNNSGLLHMNHQSHMWRLDDLLFQSSPCPALVIDGCWDSNYTNIDILSCGVASGTDPAVGAMVIIKNESNNIYMRGMRMEHAPVGALYVGANCDPIYLLTGKLDQGFIKQNAAAVTIASGGVLIIDDFNITGVSNRYVFDVSGSLVLGNVSVYGGTGMPVLNDARAWSHIDGISQPGASGASFGPIIANIHLGNSQYYRANLSSGSQTPSIVHSKIYPNRLVAQLTVSANGKSQNNGIIVQTNLVAFSNNMYDNCYLVHNATGTQTGKKPGARRKILTSFKNGQLLLQGDWACTIDADWSIEFCGGHFTPNFAADSVQLDQGMDLFSTLHTGVTIADTPAYFTAESRVAAGATIFRIRAPELPAGFDARGYFLVDEVTSEPFYISYGVNASSQIAVMYDRVVALDSARTYSLVAGYAANVKQNGSSFQWCYAGRRKTVPIAVAHSYGFDINNVPLWGLGAAGEPVLLADPDVIRPDTNLGSHFIITVTGNKPFKVDAPSNMQVGDRLLMTVRNASKGDIGTVTWHADFRLARWVNPSSGTNRTIEFCYDGAILIEINRTFSDVPN